MFKSVLSVRMLRTNLCRSKSFALFADFCGDCQKIWKTDCVSFQQTEKSVFIPSTEHSKKIHDLSNNESVSFIAYTLKDLDVVFLSILHC